VIRVPLLISVPGQTQRVDVSDPVSVVDIAPTVLELAGSLAPPSFEGHSLAPLLSQHGTGLSAWWKQLSAPRQLAPRPVFIELIQHEVLRRRRHERAVVIGRYKIIADVDGSHHFFDRMGDGKELAGDPVARKRNESLSTTT
jgi:arylsulfatase A-like enzyme